MTINDDKLITKFIKKIYDINQIMKGIYKNEPNFFPAYILTFDKAVYFDIDCIPEYVRYNIEEPFECDFIVTIKSKEFFDYFKDSTNKKSIIKIEINQNSILFYNKNESIFEIKYDEKIDYDINNGITNYKNIVDEEPIVDNINIPENIIEHIYKETSITSLILDCDNKTAHIQNNSLSLSDFEDISFIRCYVHKKFFNGLSYKIKHLSKGDVPEFTPITIDISSTYSRKEYENQNEYDVYEACFNLTLKNKDCIEHHFMICDF